MRLVTWNINSVRLRLEVVRRLTDIVRPDVLALQEIKVADPLFPREALAEMGYVHQAVAGMKSYNGVAILSRLPLSDVAVSHRCGREDCRHLSARIDGIMVHCLYVPAGGDIPDPELNDKFAHKLAFLDELTAWSAGLGDPARHSVMVGDFNIAPLPTDVWSHKQLLTVVSHTPIEVEKLTALQDSQNWVDAVRRFVPPEERLYTWWSYRNNDWSASDRGRRLDHVWVTPDLGPRLTGAMVLREVRDWPPASDHVPVMVDLV